MNRPVALALSPHLDDAAFSCGGTVAMFARTGWRVVVATLFTRSVPEPAGFALDCQLDKGIGPDIDYMALRRDEDAAAMAALGAEAEWLAFPEAPHRGYGSVEALFAEPAPDDTIVPPLSAAIAALARRFAPALVLAPQAVGGHVDHVQVVRALQMARLAAPVAWWRDFPYLARGAEPPEPFGASLAALPERAVTLTSRDVQAKRLACHCYTSQLGFQFGGAGGLDALLDSTGFVERWRGTVPG